MSDGCPHNPEDIMDLAECSRCLRADVERLTREVTNYKIGEKQAVERAEQAEAERDRANAKAASLGEALVDVCNQYPRGGNAAVRRANVVLSDPDGSGVRLLEERDQFADDQQDLHDALVLDEVPLRLVNHRSADVQRAVLLKQERDHALADAARVREAAAYITDATWCVEDQPDWPRKSCYGRQGYEKGDEAAPFWSEAFLYNLLGKEDARTLLGKWKKLKAALDASLTEQMAQQAKEQGTWRQIKKGATPCGE